MFIYVICIKLLYYCLDFMCVYACMCSLYVSLSVRLCVHCVCASVCVRAYVVRMTLVTSINILSVVDKHVCSYICPCRFDLITQCLWLNTFGQQLNVM